jgi:uncharacterized protein YndB with AHSA1/START domain
LVVQNRIEREIVIEAPVDVVWAVVTAPEHISSWFSQSAELDLRPGGDLMLQWDEYGRVHGRVERVEPPHFFSFRWMTEPGHELSENVSTLVEFSLSAEGETTRLRVVESGFADLAVSDDEKQRHLDSHSRGWRHELGELVEYVGRAQGSHAR